MSKEANTQKFTAGMEVALVFGNTVEVTRVHSVRNTPDGKVYVVGNGGPGSHRFNVNGASETTEQKMTSLEAAMALMLLM